MTRRYERLAAVYDLYDAPMERAGGAQRRHRLLSQARGEVLEVGIGTGRNLEHYPPGVNLTGIDVSGRMLERAGRRAARLGLLVRLERADVHALPYADETFDTVAAACVFCSVADPVRALAEVRRVVKRDGQVLLLEHVRPSHRLGGWLADLVSPLTRRLAGPELNRRTEANVTAAGLALSAVRREGVWREIVATVDGVATVGRRRAVTTSRRDDVSRPDRSSKPGRPPLGRP